MEINKLAKEIYANAKEKGFYDNPVELGTRLMLVTSELSEALEADRKGKYANYKGFEADWWKEWRGDIEYDHDTKRNFQTTFEHHIKDTVQDEIADAIIRLLDLAEHNGFDMEFHIKHKMAYNKLREKMHGKKY